MFSDSKKPLWNTKFTIFSRIKKHWNSKNDCIPSHCVWDFTCHCGRNYMRRFYLLFKTRFAEYIPKLLVQVANTSELPNNLKYLYPASSIAKHLTDLEYSTEPDKTLRAFWRFLPPKIRYLEVLYSYLKRDQSVRRILQMNLMDQCMC